MFRAILVLVLIPKAAGFVSPSSYKQTTKIFNVQDSKAIPFEPVGDLDVDRARECAESFGKCSVPELEKLKEGERGPTCIWKKCWVPVESRSLILLLFFLVFPYEALHKERVEHFLLDSIEVPNHFEPEEELDHRMLEEDLSIQLNLLKDEMPSSSLFPDIKADDILAPPEHKEEKILDSHKEDQIAAGIMSKNPFLLDESVDEALVMCAVVLAAVAFPFIIHS